MVMARELDVSPWEALTMSVRIAAARVAWVDEELRKRTLALDGADVATDEGVLELLHQSRLERKLMAASAKAAIDAGVAERLVRQVELEGKVLADALDAALAAVALTPDQRLVALEAAHRNLVATVPDDAGVFRVSDTFSADDVGGPDATDPDAGPGPESGTEGPGDE
jgi:hypothetical protein